MNGALAEMHRIFDEMQDENELLLGGMRCDRCGGRPNHMCVEFSINRAVPWDSPMVRRYGLCQECHGE